MRTHVRDHQSLLLACCGSHAAGCRVSGEDIHHSARLRAQFVFQVSPCKRYPWGCLQLVDTDPIRGMAPAARRSPWGLERSRSPSQRRGYLLLLCLTVGEYLALSPRQRWWHRTTRHWLVANLLLPPLIFLALYRVPFDTPKANRHERRSVYVTNAALAGEIVGLGLLLGFAHVAAVQVPVMVAASIIGVWLFSVQHRFEQAVWMRHGDWRSVDAALRGSSYLRLPPLLNWFTGNIGFHHVHHLNPRIPNYRLRECHESIAALHDVPALSFRDGLRASLFIVWDEEGGKMVMFRDVACRMAGSSPELPCSRSPALCPEMSDRRRSRADRSGLVARLIGRQWILRTAQARQIFRAS